MLKWIFLTQAIIYLLVMPFMHRSGVLGYYPSIGASILALMFLYFGFLAQKSTRMLSTEVNKDIEIDLKPNSFLPLSITALAIAYCVTVVAFGLFNRRQGSEFMADLFAGLPIYALAIIRTYEILLIPILIVYIFSNSATRLQKYVVFSSIILSLPFTGIADSRSRLLLIAIYLICFVSLERFLSFVFRSRKFYIAGLIVFGAFIFYSVQRAKGYNSFSEYLLLEVYQRLDGTNLATDLRDSGYIDKIGSFDINMLAPLISKIPFLEAARQAKLMGQTSTKQYYLQSLLGRTQLDTPNSMITDPLYFAGWAGVALAFLTLGYAIARFDHFVVRQNIMSSKHKLALAIAFVTSFALIENDMVASIIVLIQNYIFTLIFLTLGTKYVIKHKQIPDLTLKSKLIFEGKY